MVSPYSSIEKDVYGHVSLILLVGSALLVMGNFENSALIIASAAGAVLLFLYFQRIRKLPINIRTPVSDVFIALGGIISTIFIIRQISYISFLDFFSAFSPWLAIGLLSFGIISKLFLLEELFKELFRVLNGIKTNLINWSLKSRKNKWRVALVAIGLVLFFARFVIGDGILRNIFTTSSLIMFSGILLLDINEIYQFRSSRKVGTFLASISTFSGLYQFSSDNQEIGRYFLASSLLITSVDRKKLGSIIRNIYRSFQTFMISLSQSIVAIFNSTIQRIRDNYVLISRGLSFIFGTILIFIPSSTELKIASSSIATLDFMGSTLIFIAILPTVVRILKNSSIFIYLAIRHYGRLISIQIYLALISISSWFIRNNKRIMKFVTTSFSFIFMYVGPKIFFLNYILGFSMLSLTYWRQIANTINWFVTQFRRLANYFLSDYSRTIGNSGIFSILSTIFLRDKDPTLVIFMIILSTILLSIGWNFAIFRFVDRIVSWFVYIIEGSKRFFVAIFAIVYHNATLGRGISLISWIFCIVAIFGFTTFSRWVLLFTWLVLWHVAYLYRIKRLGRIVQKIIVNLIIFVKNVFIAIYNFLRNVITTFWKFMKNAIITIYSHTFVLIFWTIGLFFLVISFILVLPTTFELTRIIFGNVANDALISFIIGITLFSTAILSIQQTYVRKDKLLIGGTQS